MKSSPRLSATELTAGFGEYIDRLNALARQPDVYSGNLSSTLSALKAYKNRLIFFDNGVYVLNNLGMVMTSLPDYPKLHGDDWSNRPYFKSMLQSRRAVISNIVSDGPNKEDVVVLAVPILDPQERFNGVVVGMFHLDANAVSPFYGSMIKLHLWRSGTAIVLDGNHRVIYSSDFSQIGSAV